MGQQMQGVFAVIPGLPYKLVQHCGFFFFACLSVPGSKPLSQGLFHVQW
jgi:hypothetical protein